jgi:hypothetical protein
MKESNVMTTSKNQPLGTLRWRSGFDVYDTLPGPQRKIRTLWNQIAPYPQNGGQLNRTTQALPYNRPRISAYLVAPHRGPDSVLIVPSNSMLSFEDDISGHSLPYSLCPIAGHRLTSYTQ